MKNKEKEKMKRPEPGEIYSGYEVIDVWDIADFEPPFYEVALKIKGELAPPGKIMILKQIEFEKLFQPIIIGNLGFTDENP